jgi:hypothetical protein
MTGRYAWFHQHGKLDPDPEWHQNDADPQNWTLKGKVWFKHFETHKMTLDRLE